MELILYIDLVSNGFAKLIYFNCFLDYFGFSVYVMISSIFPSSFIRSLSFLLLPLLPSLSLVFPTASSSFLYWLAPPAECLIEVVIAAIFGLFPVSDGKLIRTLKTLIAVGFLWVLFISIRKFLLFLVG